MQNLLKKTDLTPDLVPFSQNTPDARVQRHLDWAVFHDLKGILPSDLWNALYAINRVTTGKTDLQVWYEANVLPYLILQGFANYLTDSNIDSTPSGERSFKDEYSDLISAESLSFRQRQYKAKADVLKGEMLSAIESADYLIAGVQYRKPEVVCGVVTYPAFLPFSGI